MTLELLKGILIQHDLLQKYGLMSVGIFGSLARGDANPKDIDLYIEELHDYRKLIQFKNELEKLTQTRTDIVIKKYANPLVMNRAKKDMVYVTQKQ